MTAPLASLGRRPVALASSFLLAVDARDYPLIGNLVARTGQTLTYARTTNGSLATLSDGRVATVLANQPRMSWVDFDGDGALEAVGRPAVAATTNLILRSGDPTHAAWTKTNTTAVASTTVRAPDGTLAVKVFENAVNTTHFLTATGITVAAGAYGTMSVFIKAAERSRVYFGFENGANTCYATARLDLGTISSAVGGTGTALDVGLQAFGNGWYRAWVTGRTGAAVTALTCRMFLLDGTGASSYAGATTNGVYLWGMDFQAGDTSGARVLDHIPTTSASVASGGEALTVATPGFTCPDTLTLYARFARPLWGSATAHIGGSAPLVLRWGGNPNGLAIYIENTGASRTIAGWVYDGSGVQAVTAVQSMPAAQAVGITPVEVCLQVTATQTAAKCRLDVGSGFGAYSSTVGTVVPTGAIGLGCDPSGTGNLCTPWQTMRIATGALTLAQMRDGY